MLISVLMPVYNGERFLGEAIESVLRQTHEDLELIVVDDGSTDGTARILAEAAARDARVRVIRQQNSGVAVARNRALAACRAEWVTNLDSDDVMLPERIARQIAFLEAHPSVKVFACRAYYINDSGKILGKTKREPFCDEAELRRYLAEGGIVGVNQSSVMMHRPTILALGGYQAHLKAVEDIDLWNRVVEAGHLMLLQDEILTRYRIHDQSIVTSKMRAVLLDYEWVRACILARRAGRPEPTREAFLEAWRRRPWYQRLHTWITNEAKTHYRAAAFEFAAGRPVRGGGRLALATVCRPDYVIGRLAGQFVLDRSQPVD